MFSRINPVYEPAKAASKLSAVCFHHRGCRVGAQSRQHTVDASPRSDHVSERQTRRDEPHDLLIAWVIVAVNEIDGVSASNRFGIASCEQRVQAFADTVHFAGVLAILASERQ
jgi:hypothetical protein